jgi:hypothetical protein
MTILREFPLAADGYFPKAVGCLRGSKLPPHLIASDPDQIKNRFEPMTGAGGGAARQGRPNLINPLRKVR